MINPYLVERKVFLIAYEIDSSVKVFQSFDKLSIHLEILKDNVLNDNTSRVDQRLLYYVVLF